MLKINVPKISFNSLHSKTSFNSLCSKTSFNIDSVFDVVEKAQPHFNFAYNIVSKIAQLPEKPNVFNYVEVGLYLRSEIFHYLKNQYNENNLVSSIVKDYFPMILPENLFKVIESDIVSNANLIKSKTLLLINKLDFMKYKDFNFIYHQTRNSSNEKFKGHKFYFKNGMKDLDLLYGYIAEKLWTKFGCNFLSIKTDLECAKINVNEVPCTKYNALPSNLSNKIIDEILVFKDQSRSFLLYGPPGSGKTKAIENVVLALNRKTLFFGNVYNENVNFSKMLNPDIIVITDLDHYIKNDQSSLTSLLTFLEEFQQKPNKIVLASCNVVKSLDHALQRPERFDRLIEVKSLDEDVHLKLVNDDEDLFNFTKDFPAAFIQEFMKRVNVYGKDEALKDSNDIKDRVKNLKDKDYGL